MAQVGGGLRDGGVRRSAAGGGEHLGRGAVGVGCAAGEEAQREGRRRGGGRGNLSRGRGLRPVPRVLHIRVLGLRQGLRLRSHGDGGRRPNAVAELGGVHGDAAK